MEIKYIDFDKIELFFELKNEFRINFIKIYIEIWEKF